MARTVRTLKDVNAELAAAAATEPDQEMTREEVNAYVEFLDAQRQELDIENHENFVALEVIRTLIPYVNFHLPTTGDLVFESVRTAVADKIREAIKHIKFPVVEA